MMRIGLNRCDHTATAASMLLLLLATCQPEIKILGNNEIIHSNYPLHTEHWQERSLAVLKRQEKFDQIKAHDEVDLLIKLCDWTHRQWKHSIPNPWPLDNALSILRDIRAGRTGGWCGQYAYAFVDVVKSMGFLCARYVELAASLQNTHFVAEVWSNQLAKWIVFDPDYNIYFRRRVDGVPASALEVRDAFFGGPAVEPVVIGGGPIQVGNGHVYTPETFLRFYRTVAVSTRSDLMRQPQPWSTQERQGSFVFYDDGHDLKPFDKKNPYKIITHRREDIEFSCNMVHVDYSIGEDLVRFELNTEGSSPSFKRFLVANTPLSQTRPPVNSLFKPSKGQLVLRRSDGDRRLWIQADNQLGRRGAMQGLSLRW